MIRTLTEPFAVLRDEETQRQNELKQRVLELLQEHGATACCLLCGRALSPATHSRGSTLYVRPPDRPAPENGCTCKVVECCITRSEILEIVAANEGTRAPPSPAPRESNVCGACFANLHSYPRPVFSGAETQVRDALPLSAVLERLGARADVQRMLESRDMRRRRDALREFRKRQIRYKIGIVEEQMGISYRNYMDALEMSEHSDAGCFKGIYNELFEAREELMRRLEDGDAPVD